MSERIIRVTTLANPPHRCYCPPMSSPLEKYLDGIEHARILTNATEHTYRQYLAYLIGEIASECVAVNEPKRSECGAPDYVVMEKQSRLTRSYIKAKDIGVSLDEAA